jgi:dihydrofolate reductase
LKPLAIIVAMTPDGVIGKGNTIPWRFPEDLKRFKALTTNHAIVMGRKTFESIGRPLPNRTNIIISRTATLDSLGLAGGHGPDNRHCNAVTRDLEAALELAHQMDAAANADSCPYVIGGAEIYRLALPFATRAEVTLVHEQDVTGEDVVRFPRPEDGAPLSPWTWGPWRLAKVQNGEAWEIEYLTFERRPKP